MPQFTILPDPAHLHLLGMSADATTITVSVATTASEAPCPICGARAGRVHSRYVRCVVDLPWHGATVQMHLRVRRFFCDNPACRRQIFTERLPGVVAPYGRRTERLEGWFTAVGFAAGGEAGRRLLHVLGLATSAATLLRRIRRSVVPVRGTPRVLSVDDF
jgi:transposase